MMLNKMETPSAEELLWKILKLEEGHRRLKQNISNLMFSGENSNNNNNYYYLSDRQRSNWRGRVATLKLLDWPESNRETAVNLTETQYMNILESMGRAVYMFDVKNRIVYWNRMSENMYGYTAAEAIGKTAPDIVVEATNSVLATLIIQRSVKEGESWSGQFPVRTKYGQAFTVISALSPCCDENGAIFGATCVCADARQFPQQSPLQTAIVSKISFLASKVKLKMKTGETNMDHDSYFAPHSSASEHFNGKPTTDSNEAWMGKKGLSRPWKGNENRDTSDIRPSCFGLPWLHDDQEQESKSSSASLTLQSQRYESPSNNKEALRSYSCGTSTSLSFNSNSIDETCIHIENSDVEILWEDMEQIGQGSRGTVYHALLYGSDVAVKILNKQEYPGDVIPSFRKEVRLMKRLRHPNILPFIGAVISPLHLCIVTEFLPRGSLFRLLHSSTTKLDWRRRVHMAMDIARGMNYLHHCQPPIIHRNLKSSNLLVDKNLTLKVGDFGLSRIKHETYMATNTGAGTPRWMAPEVLRNEQVDEKSDVYSYGVVLWEITTGKIPWETLNWIQVVGAVGFMDQRLEVPNNVDSEWASLIGSCWSREPRYRPTFQEILIKLKDLQKKFMIQ